MALLSSVRVLRFGYYQSIVSYEAKCVLSVADPRANCLVRTYLQTYLRSDGFLFGVSSDIILQMPLSTVIETQLKGSPSHSPRKVGYSVLLGRIRLHCLAASFDSLKGFNQECNLSLRIDDLSNFAKVACREVRTLSKSTVLSVSQTAACRPRNPI